MNKPQSAHGEHIFARLLQLERQARQAETSESQAWYGTDITVTDPWCGGAERQSRIVFTSLSGF